MFIDKYMTNEVLTRRNNYRINIFVHLQKVEEITIYMYPHDSYKKAITMGSLLSDFYINHADTKLRSDNRDLENVIKQAPNSVITILVQYIRQFQYYNSTNR